MGSATRRESTELDPAATTRGDCGFEKRAQSTARALGHGQIRGSTYPTNQTTTRGASAVTRTPGKRETSYTGASWPEQAAAPGAACWSWAREPCRGESPSLGARLGRCGAPPGLVKMLLETKQCGARLRGSVNTVVPAAAAAFTPVRWMEVGGLVVEIGWGGGGWKEEDRQS